MGLPGLSGIELMVNTLDTQQLRNGVNAPSVTVTASCPTGKVALSGGASMSQNGGFTILSKPVVVAGQAVGWQSFVTTSSGNALPIGSNVTATPYVVCALAQ